MPRPTPNFSTVSVKFSEKFPDKTLVDYLSYHAPVKIQCPLHGEREFSSFNAAMKSTYGCPKCALDSRSSLLSSSGSHNIKLYVYDIHGQSVLEFPSIISASNFLNISSSTLGNKLKRSAPNSVVTITDQYVISTNPFETPPVASSKIPQGFIPVSDYPNYYIHENGSVYSVKTDTMLTPSWNSSSNSCLVRLSNDEGFKSFTLARLVWATFRPNTPLPRKITYKDGNRRNCALDNLE